MSRGRVNLAQRSGTKDVATIADLLCRFQQLRGLPFALRSGYPVATQFWVRGTTSI